MKVGAFFSAPNAGATEASKTTKPAVKSKVDSKSTAPKPEQEEAQETNMTLNLKIEKPDIILVEHMDNIDTNALILNVSCSSSERK